MNERKNFFEVDPQFEFWIGQDAKIESDFEAKAGMGPTPIHIRVTKEHLPPREAISPWVSYSVRSTLSQLGIETFVGLDRLRDERLWDELDASGEASLEVHVANHGYRGIALQKGDDVMRFYLRSREGRYEGKSLARHLREKDVVHGIEGEEWWLLGRDDSKRTLEEPGDATVVCLPYDPNLRLWVPPAKEPIRITKRADLEKYLEPMPKNIEPDFYVSETLAKVQMAERPGLLLTGAEDETHHRHTQSNLIDPEFGRSAGGKPIRLEILDPGVRSHEKPYVYLEIWPAPGEGK